VGVWVILDWVAEILETHRKARIHEVPSEGDEKMH